jgi:hypothetical protein
MRARALAGLVLSAATALGVRVDAAVRRSGWVKEDPHWRDRLLFYEYFHGDNGAGLGASHQTGWTGVIARAMHLFATSTAEQFLDLGKLAGITEGEPARGGQSGSAAPTRKR